MHRSIANRGCTHSVKRPLRLRSDKDAPHVLVKSARASFSCDRSGAVNLYMEYTKRHSSHSSH